MKKTLAVVLTVLLMVPALWAQQALPITRVLLYKNGMAYIVRSGELAAPMSLTFHPEDMNDVLKSFSAWNPLNGALYSVGYTTGIPSSHMLGRFPFDMQNPDMGLGAFLAQVKGAALRLDLGGRILEGKLIAVQQTDHVISQQTSTSDYRLTVLLENASLQTVWLSDVQSTEFVDPALRDQLRSYLDVLAEGRQDVTREVSLYPVPSPGPVQVAYLQQFPLWKTSYRVDLQEGAGRIQGWAQIDNPTGESWNNVQVSLLSGSPVSFVMNLYEPLYTSRTAVNVPGGQVAAPRQYESALKTADVARDSPSLEALAANVPGANLQIDGFTALREPRPAPGAGGGRAGPVQAAAAAPPALFQQADSMQVNDFFEYTFPFPVQLASRQSALLPFLQKTIDVERLSIFNPRTDRGNPQLGARLNNTSDIPFEPGPVTFFDSGRYAGEAVLNYLPRGEKRLVSFGVDHDVQIAAKSESQPEVSTRLTINRGIAVLHMESTVTTSYEIRNKGKERKSLIVEHPRQNDRTLKGAEPSETTDNFYRFRVGLTPEQSTNLPVVEVVARQSTVTLQNLTRGQLVMFSGRETPQAIREKLGEIVDLQEQIAVLRSGARTSQETVDGLFRDQERLRENIKALRDSREDQELRTRYLDQLSKQEDQIESSRAQIEALNKEINATQTRLGDLISNLTWGV